MENKEKLTFFRDEEKKDTESIWVDAVGNNNYKLLNSPFYLYNISYEDILKAHIEQGIAIVDEIIERSGNSTYRVFISKKHSKEMEAIILRYGCSFEGMFGNEYILYSINVPISADINNLYDELSEGEDNNLWEFEEAHFGR